MIFKSKEEREKTIKEMIDYLIKNGRSKVVEYYYNDIKSKDLTIKGLAFPRLHSAYHNHIMVEEIKKLNLALYRSELPYSEGFAIKSYRFLNYDFNWGSRSFSFIGNLKNPYDRTHGRKRSIALNKPFEQLNNDERLEIIQDYFYNQYYGNTYVLRDIIRKEGAEQLESIERDKILKEKRRQEEIAELKEKERLLEEEQERQRIKESIAGKLIQKSIAKVVNDSCSYPGVYLIVNTKTLDFYIGESQNVSFRRLTHLGEMNDPTKDHHRPLIQKHFNLYGASVFDFYVLERVDDDTNDGLARKRIEAFYIKEFNPTYNISTFK